METNNYTRFDAFNFYEFSEQSRSFMFAIIIDSRSQIPVIIEPVSEKNSYFYCFGSRSERKSLALTSRLRKICLREFVPN